MILRAMLIAGFAASLAGCATPPRFEFGAYESTLYSYYKNPQKIDKFETALERAIEKGIKEDRLAPGLFAELGYLALARGDRDRAIELFGKEYSNFPESSFLMKSLINKLQGTKVANEIASTRVLKKYESVSGEKLKEAYNRNEILVRVAPLESN